MSRADAARPGSTIPLAWSLPPGVLVVALLWLLPLAVGGASARRLAHDAVGNRVVLGIWLTWSVTLAIAATAVTRGGRHVVAAWTVVQVALLLVVAAWALAPLLLGAPALERPAEAAAHLLLPVIALVLSAVQGLLLFFSA